MHRARRLKRSARFMKAPYGGRAACRRTELFLVVPDPCTPMRRPCTQFSRAPVSALASATCCPRASTGRLPFPCAAGFPRGLPAHCRRLSPDGPGRFCRDFGNFVDRLARLAVVRNQVLFEVLWIRLLFHQKLEIVKCRAGQKVVGFGNHGSSSHPPYTVRILSDGCQRSFTRTQFLHTKAMRVFMPALQIPQRRPPVLRQGGLASHAAPLCRRRTEIAPGRTFGSAVRIVGSPTLRLHGLPPPSASFSPRAAVPCSGGGGGGGGGRHRILRRATSRSDRLRALRYSPYSPIAPSQNSVARNAVSRSNDAPVVRICGIMASALSPTDLTATAESSVLSTMDT